MREFYEVESVHYLRERPLSSTAAEAGLNKGNRLTL